MSNEEIIAELRTYPSPERIKKLCQILEVNLAADREWYLGGVAEATKQTELLRSANRKFERRIADLLGPRQGP